MWGFQRGSGLLAAALRIPRAPRAQFKSQPPEHQLSLAEQGIALTAIFISFLVPTAWVLGHLEHYKKKSE